MKHEMKNLDFLTMVEVLNDNSQDKMLTLLAKDADEQMAVVVLSKKPFQAEMGQQFISKCDLKLDLKNDCYHTFGKASETRIIIKLRLSKRIVKNGPICIFQVY